MGFKQSKCAGSWNKRHWSPGFTLSWKNSSKEQRRFWSSRAGASINVSLWAKHRWQMKLQRYHLLSCSISWSWDLMGIETYNPNISLMWYILYILFQGCISVQTNIDLLEANGSSFYQILPISTKFSYHHLQSGLPAWTRSWKWDTIIEILQRFHNLGWANKKSGNYPAMGCHALRRVPQILHHHPTS